MRVTKNKVLYKFYNFMSDNKNIQRFMNITFKKYMNEEEEYILIGSICPYNYWTDCYILKSDKDKYNKLKKSNPEIFERVYKLKEEE